jgi:pantothenate synthetase
MSSRNTKLSRNQMEYAERIYRFIKNNKKLILNKILKKKKLQILKKLIELGASKVDYVECINLVNKQISKNSKLNYWKS